MINRDSVCQALTDGGAYAGGYLMVFSFHAFESQVTLLQTALRHCYTRGPQRSGLADTLGNDFPSRSQTLSAHRQMQTKRRTEAKVRSQRS